MSRIGSQIKFIRLLATVPLCAACVGCIVVPIHTSTKTTSATGEEVGKKVDLTFIKLGVTGREEVMQKLGWIDTGVKNEG